MDEAAAPLEIAGAAEPVPVSDSAAGPIRRGLANIVVFFGVFGGWAAMSPLDGAIVGEGVVTVDGNRKSVEHLEGGIVKEIRVKEGDHVDVGDILVVLDDSRLKSQADILAQQLVVARATEARLVAELDDRPSVAFPSELLQAPEDYVKRAVASQEAEFDARRTALLGSQQVLEHKIADLREQIAGKRARQTATEAQLASIKGEEESLRGLLDQGLTTRARMLDLERNAQSLQADISDNLAAIASAEQNIAETQQQITQLVNDRRAQIASDLNDTQAKLLDLGPQLEAARASLARTVVRSPYAGRVVGLKVFSTGAVVAPGGTILDIVPDRTDLVVDTRIRVEDISDVAVGAPTEIHFTTYRRLYVPMLRGRVATVSADRLTDERTGAAYYMAQVVVNAADLAHTRDVTLYPGMPAQVMVTTRKRSALEYMVGPLFAAFDNAFRQN
jgi:epimerase transport system membrane fusion protein